MKSQGILIPWFCLAASASVNLAFANEGLDAYRLGNYSKASALLANDPSKDPVIDYYMGRMRLYGYGLLKNNTAALASFKRAAEKGFLPAEHIMAIYTLLEEHNPEQALTWFKKAADAGDTRSQMYCAAAYLFGVGVKKNPELAKRYYIAAAKSGDSIAQYAVAESFLDSRQPGNKKLGLIWLNKAVAQNNPAAQTKLGELYSNGGSLVTLDLAKAKELIGLAVAQGYTPALYQMGELAKKQNDVLQAKEWFSKAAISNYEPAVIAISKLYFEPKSPIYNPHTGFLWMLKAAQNGSHEAQLALAGMYKNGQGVDADENLAKEWQQKATQSLPDSPELAKEKAAKWLSMGKTNHFVANGYRLKGIFTEWQNPEALKENNYNQPPQMELVDRRKVYKPQFVMARPNDIPISEYYDVLASILDPSSAEKTFDFPRYPIDKQLMLGQQPGLSGAGASQGMINHLKSRAVLGDTTAQFVLAQLYQEGIGTTKDIQAAIKQYELASDQQELRAEYNLGLIYLEGSGVPADYQKAITLLRDAAFKGNDYSQYVLARIAELGYHNSAGEEVIKPDPEQALVMYELAAANDYGLAQFRLAEMLVRQKKTDLSMEGKRQRNQMLKQLYEGAFAAGVAQAALPLAFFNAMDQDKAKQAQAFAVAKKEADAGNLGASLLLGLLNDRGIGEGANQAAALSAYEKAQSNPVTDFILGTYYSQGTGVKKDVDKGKALLKRSANSGFSYANLNLGILNQEGGGAFLPELEMALSLGNSTAGLLLADYYLSQATDDAKMKQARDIYQHLAERGDKEAQVKLGYMLDQGLGGAVDLENAIKWYTMAAEQGQVSAQYFLGKLYQLGRIGQQPDYDLAKKWYSAAQHTYAPAAVAIGFINDTVDDNYQQAFVDYQLAADQLDPIGQFNLGLIYEKGKGRPVDYAKAKELYQAAATQGNRQAMTQLAGLYFNGLIGSRDEEEALNWYKKAAELGDRDALYQLGLLSETGVATKLDFTMAVNYYRQAADRGDAKAKLALARIYQYGLGVEKNSQQAFKYYKELAELGNAYAQYQLASLYYDGIDGKRMPQQGKQWLQQAQANGSQQARRILQWLDAQAQDRTSFIEPVLMSQTSTADEQPAELMYLDALSAWNRGDERSSRMIFNRLFTQFPHYGPAKRAYDQLNQQLAHPGILG